MQKTPLDPRSVRERSPDEEKRQQGQQLVLVRLSLILPISILLVALLLLKDGEPKKTEATDNPSVVESRRLRPTEDDHQEVQERVASGFLAFEDNSLISRYRSHTLISQKLGFSVGSSDSRLEPAC